MEGDEPSGSMEVKKDEWNYEEMVDKHGDPCVDGGEGDATRGDELISTPVGDCGAIRGAIESKLSDDCLVSVDAEKRNKHKI